MSDRSEAAAVAPRKLREFTRRVLEDLDTLQEILASGRIDSDVRRLGAEQEVFLVDRAWEPAPAVDLLLDELDDEHFTCEIARFNLEINLDAVEMRGSCFDRLERQLKELIGRLRKVADRHQLSVILTGILPTLRLDHLTPENMTPRPRYQALAEAMKRLRGEDFAINIRGLDELRLEHDNVMFEACNTSFQVHYQVSTSEFASVYNAAQAVAGPLLAVASNAPLLFGRRLWAETRIPLFQQSVDTRSEMPPERRRMPRVSFGRRWVEESVLEIYREDVGRFPALLSADAAERDDEGEGPPSLRALSAHNGTVYRWNRPCYGITDGRPHLRIENRYLPSGPTIADEVANAAFWCGLLSGVSSKFPDLSREMPFEMAQRNFMRAARDGIGAQIDWPGRKGQPADAFARSFLLPLAREGLQELGVTQGDIDLYLAIIDYRVSNRATGAQWQLDSLSGGEAKPGELAALTAGLHSRQVAGDPVARWTPAPIGSRPRATADLRVADLMTPSPFALNEEQVIDLAASIMDWRRIRHVPIEDTSHRFVGLVTYRSLLRTLLDQDRDDDALIPVREAMITDVEIVSPETPAREALERMRRLEIGCLPVVQNGSLVGILSERDFMTVAESALQGPTRPVRADEPRLAC